MSLSLNFLDTAWNYRVSLSELIPSLANHRFSPLPVIATYLLFDATWIVRAIFKRHYVPMYFIFFPSGHPDTLYARYLREDDPFSVSPRLSQAQKKRVANDIRVSATISMLLACVVAPWLVGFLAALYLTPAQFSEFLWVLLIAKAIFIFNSLRTLVRESPATSDTRIFIYILLLYAVYLGLVYYGLTESFYWTSANIASYSVAGLVSAFIRTLYFDIFISIIVSALVIFVISNLLLARADKRENE